MKSAWAVLLGFLTLNACGKDASSPAAPAAPAPDFTVQCAPGAVSAPAGCAAATCTVTPLNGFSGAVALDCAGAPAGLTCSLGPTPLDVSAGRPATIGLTVSADFSAAGRSLNVEVVGQSGATRRTTTIRVDVGTVPRPTSTRMAIVGCAGYTAGSFGTNSPQTFLGAIVGSWRGGPGVSICTQVTAQPDGSFILETERGCFGTGEPVHLTSGGLPTCVAFPYEAGTTVHATLLGRRDGVCR